MGDQVSKEWAEFYAPMARELDLAADIYAERISAECSEFVAEVLQPEQEEAFMVFLQRLLDLTYSDHNTTMNLVRARIEEVLTRGR